MTLKYDFDFNQDSPYGRALHLVAQYGRPNGVVIDFGCGIGPVADALAALGLDYIGLDLDSEAIQNLRRRGIDAHLCDITDQDSLQEILDEAIGERTVSAFLALDSIEHVPDPDSLVGTLKTLAVRYERPTLVVSIPNVSHFDVGAKLLHGMWEMTDTGLLDRTHLAFFTGPRLTEMLQSHGFSEVGRNDFRLERSDQHTPTHFPAISESTPLGQHLRSLRDGVDPDGNVNQFVRAYSCGETTGRTQESAPSPGLSVVMRTQGGRLELLDEALLSLAGQTDPDFEVLLMVHTHDDRVVEDVRGVVGRYSPAFSRRVRITPVSGGDRSRPLNRALAIARGAYVAFLDDDDVVLADWVETFNEGGAESPGSIVRTVAADQEVRRTDSESGYIPLSGAVVDPSRIDFDFVRHLETNRTPICAFAAPMTAISTYSIEFDEELRVLEDWHFFIRVASVCGVHNVPKVTSLYRRWKSDTASWHTIDRDVWAASRSRIQLELDSHPILLPQGSVFPIVNMIQDVHAWVNVEDPIIARERLKELESELATSRRRVKQMEASSSWRVTRPLRALGRALRRH